MSKENQDKRTPGKWEVKPCTAGGGLLLRGGPDPRFHPQASIQIVPLADAQFIVTACNAHDELVDALKAIWAVCESGGKRGRPMDIMSNSDYEWARKKYDKALAQLNPTPEKSHE